MKPGRKGGGKRAFLPAGTADALSRAGLRLIGLGLTAAAAIVLIALFTANPHDPSLNATGFGSVHNALGRVGAIIADLLQQFFGLAAFILVLIPLVWGVRIVMVSHAPTLWRVRLGMAALSVILSTLALSQITSADTYDGHMGGALGSILQEGIAPLIPSEWSWAPAAISALGALGLLIFALGLQPSEWRRLGQHSSRYAGQAAQALAHVSVTATRRMVPRSARADLDPSLNTRKSPLPANESTHLPNSNAQRDPENDPEFDKDASFDDQPADRNHAVVVEARQPPVAPGKREQATRQGSLNLGVPPPQGYVLPPLDLLSLPKQSTVANVSEDGLTQNARMLETVLDDFGVNGQVVKVRPGPVVTLYELEPAPGTKTSRVIGLADDIARSMSALAVRIATVPGRNVIGIELPNSVRETVFLRELLAAEQFEKAPSRLTLVLGKDIGGAPVMVDLARMPHLLIAGTTGSGKSVAVNTMILSLLYRLPPEECRLIMIDPKMLELSVYDGIPHLLAPVVTEPGKAVVALKWAVREMEDRYRAMSQLGVRNIAGYNQRLAEASEKGEVLTRTVQTGFDPDTGKPIYEDQILALNPLPFIVIIVDEMADLMLVAGKDVEGAIQRLAQMARAAGIHLIMATQRPSVDVITGTIKANFPTRISFQVTSKIDSRTILSEQGAEQLLGQGDMLYMAAGGRITRIHGPFVSDREVEHVVDHLRDQGQPDYLEAITEEEQESFGDGPGAGGGNGGGGDEFYDQAVALVAREGKASTSFIQRHFQIGYNRAARIIEKMEAQGVISKPNRVGKREVLVGSAEY